MGSPPLLDVKFKTHQICPNVFRIPLNKCPPYNFKSLLMDGQKWRHNNNNMHDVIKRRSLYQFDVIPYSSLDSCVIWRPELRMNGTWGRTVKVPCFPESFEEIEDQFQSRCHLGLSDRRQSLRPEVRRDNPFFVIQNPKWNNFSWKILALSKQTLPR